MLNSICDVPGIKVGHAQNINAMTGCTVILPDKSVVAGVHVPGSAPGSRELTLLHPTKLVQEVHAIVLTGGSAFGLESANGVVQFLDEKNIGYDTGIARVPIVPAAVIFDLAVGSAKIRPDKAMGYSAAINASVNNEEGLIGAGTGATVGKFAGQLFAMKGGIGTCSLIIDDSLVIAALVVVNALGNIIDYKTGKTIAGAFNPDNHDFFDPFQFVNDDKNSKFSHLTNTTLAVVATNACLSKTQATILAQMASTGIAKVTEPAHTLYDGDITFAIAAGEVDKFDLQKLGSAAAILVAEAILRAVKLSNSNE